MISTSLRWTPATGWSTVMPAADAAQVQLLLAFGPVNAPDHDWFLDVATRWPMARLVYITAGGQIQEGEIVDGSVVVTALGFREGKVHVVLEEGAGQRPCDEVGAALGAALLKEPALTHAMVFSDGLSVNGAALTRGLGNALPRHVTVSGGLASDGVEFKATGVGLDGAPRANVAVAIGFYGASIVVGTGTAGGWVPFGPDRIVTGSDGPVLRTLDGERALTVYKKELAARGSEAAASALLFPLAVTTVPGAPYVVRTILGLDEATGSIRFAGDIPQGATVRIMKSTDAQLLSGAASAAEAARAQMDGVVPSAMICVSCIGRRAVLKERTEHELDEVAAQASGAVLAGYYSNGEIAPSSDVPLSPAVLHNQTMSVTAIGER